MRIKVQTVVDVEIRRNTLGHWVTTDSTIFTCNIWRNVSAMFTILLRHISAVHCLLTNACWLLFSCMQSEHSYIHTDTIPSVPLDNELLFAS